MNIQSSFEINAAARDAWMLLTDIERVAPCFPGAELGEALGNGMYRAGFKIKLGPVSLNFSGKVGFVELDQAGGLAVLKASGSDTKGRGGAQGSIRCRLVPQEGKSRVSLDTTVDLSGSIAQYGRGQGMIADLTQQLVERFARNLEALTVQSASAPAAGVNPSNAKANSPAVAADQVQVGGLVAGAFWRAVKRFFARLLGRAA
jgi:carbon monoxide dehydrogenase subunit G